MTLPTLPAWLVLVTVTPVVQEDRLDEVRGLAVSGDWAASVPFVRLALTEGGHPPTTAETDAEGRFVYRPLRVPDLASRRARPVGAVRNDARQASRSLDLGTRLVRPRRSSRRRPPPVTGETAQSPTQATRR